MPKVPITQQGEKWAPPFQLCHRRNVITASEAEKFTKLVVLPLTTLTFEIEVVFASRS